LLIVVEFDFSPSICFVIPGLTRNPVFFYALQDWMPDRTRHDKEKYHALLNPVYSYEFILLELAFNAWIMSEDKAQANSKTEHTR